MPSKAFRDYEAVALWYIPRKQRVDYAVTVKCLFYMPTRRKCDLTNLLEAIDDIMVKAGLLADDNFTIIESHDGSRVFYDKDRPRTEVYISPISKGGDNMSNETREDKEKQKLDQMREKNRRLSQLSDAEFAREFDELSDDQAKKILEKMQEKQKNGEE